MDLVHVIFLLALILNLVITFMNVRGANSSKKEDEIEWRAQALSIGCCLGNRRPANYSALTPEQWARWARTQVYLLHEVFYQAEQINSCFACGGSLVPNPGNCCDPMCEEAREYIDDHGSPPETGELLEKALDRVRNQPSHENEKD